MVHRVWKGLSACYPRIQLITLHVTIMLVITIIPYSRFIVPKEQFMELNRRNEGGVMQEMVLPLKRKYTKRVDREKTENGILKVKIQPPSSKRRLK